MANISACKSYYDIGLQDKFLKLKDIVDQYPETIQVAAVARRSTTHAALLPREEDMLAFLQTSIPLDGFKDPRPNLDMERPTIAETSLNDMEVAQFMLKMVVTSYVLKAIEDGEPRDAELLKLCQTGAVLIDATLSKHEFEAITTAAIGQISKIFRFLICINDPLEGSCGSNQDDFESVFGGSKGHFEAVLLATRNSKDAFYTKRMTGYLNSRTAMLTIKPTYDMLLVKIKGGDDNSISVALAKLPEWRRAVRKINGVTSVSPLESLVVEKLQSKAAEAMKTGPEVDAAKQYVSAKQLYELIKDAEATNGAAMQEIGNIKGKLLAFMDTAKSIGQTAIVARVMKEFAEIESLVDEYAKFVDQQVKAWKEVQINSINDKAVLDMIPTAVPNQENKSERQPS